MPKIEINNTLYQTPNTFNELKPAHLKVLFTIFSKEGALIDKLLDFTKYLLSLSDEFLKKWETDAGAEDYLIELYDVIQNTTKPFLTENTLTLTLTKPPFKTLHSYEGPAEMLKNSEFLEFATADKYYQNFIGEDIKEHRLKIIASLYRDRNKPFNIDNNYYKFKTLETWKQYAIIHFFASCRSEIMDRIPGRFSSRVGEEQGGNDFGWAGVALSLTGTQFGTLKEVHKTDIWSVIVHLHILDEQIRKQKIKK